ncbi:MAG: metallophosphoesterase [Deltaproteobacteria bacterium]|nr:metallophosphoesterase [Deltaproteobacteria bacterium]
MGRRFLVLSDLHLCDVEDHADDWMAYKSSRFVFDKEVAALLRRFTEDAESDGDERVLVFNGDLVDFDLVATCPEPAPWPVTRSERRRGLNATEEKSAWKLERVLADHPLFVESLTRFLLAGHRLIYVLGNHDQEFHFPKVRSTLISALQAEASKLNETLKDDCIRFEPWFYLEPGEVYIEHGQQYDHYTSFRHLLDPTVQISGEERIALPMGNLSNRYLMTKMGFFNPFASDYILSAFAYFWHWLSHYAFSRRSLAFVWFWGSLVVMGKLLRIRKRLLKKHVDQDKLLGEVADRFGMEPATAQALQKLQQVPITSRFFRIVREFWIDRVIFMIFWGGGTIALALVPIPLWIKLMVPLTSFPLLLFIYEKAIEGESIFTIESRLPQVARSIGALVPVQVVAFGHSHVPRLIPLSRDLVFVDTGTWAPITEADPHKLAPGYRNYLELRFDDEKELTLRFDAWMLPDPKPARSKSA